MRFNLVFFCFIFTISLNAQNPKDKADKLYANGNYSKAIETYKSVKNLDEVYDEIAKAYMAIGNYGEGLANYKKAIESNPDDTLLISEVSPSQTETYIIEGMDHMLRFQKEKPSILSYANSCSSPIMQEVNERIYEWISNQKANK